MLRNVERDENLARQMNEMMIFSMRLIGPAFDKRKSLDTRRLQPIEDSSKTEVFIGIYVPEEYYDALRTSSDTPHEHLD